jgi:hypothetical protein
LPELIWQGFGPPGNAYSNRDLKLALNLNFWKSIEEDFLVWVSPDFCDPNDAQLTYFGT